MAVSIHYLVNECLREVKKIPPDQRESRRLRVIVGVRITKRRCSNIYQVFVLAPEVTPGQLRDLFIPFKDARQVRIHSTSVVAP